MKYPYIGKGKISDAIMLFVSDVKAVTLDRGNSFYNGEQSELVEGLFTNITHEYLSNTWGVVESKEHAEFIIELAELHGLPFNDLSNSYGKFFSFDSGTLCFLTQEFIAKSGCKQITIPLPPKAEENEAGHNLVFAASECKEWPCVNDEVTWGDLTHKGVVKSISDGFAWIKRDSGEYETVYISSLQKPKTPEEALRDDVSTYLCDKYKFIFKAEAMEILESLLTKYNITPKD